MDELEQKLKKYLGKASPSFEEITVLMECGQKVKETALAYFSDAKHFYEKGEYVNAFAALEYAEGWLDCGVALEVLSAKGKDPKAY
jgi:hypothetical protein